MNASPFPTSPPVGESDVVSVREFYGNDHVTAQGIPMPEVLNTNLPDFEPELEATGGPRPAPWAGRPLRYWGWTPIDLPGPN
jgi:hypothetical protein